MVFFLVLGLLPGVDNFAHLGGLVGGVLMGLSFAQVRLLVVCVGWGGVVVGCRGKLWCRGFMIGAACVSLSRPNTTSPVTLFVCGVTWQNIHCGMKNPEKLSVIAFLLLFAYIAGTVVTIKVGWLVGCVG